MIKTFIAKIRKAYGAGWRAGRSNKVYFVIDTNLGETIKHIATGEDLCPFRRGLLRAIWLHGYFNGQYKRLTVRYGARRNSLSLN